MLTGCSAGSLRLDKRWLPLTHIVERNLPFIPDNVVTTIGTTAYISNLDEFLENNQPGSPRFESLMLHEQIHSIRQLNYGIIIWIINYMIYPSFRWEEERLGWEADIRFTKRHGIAKKDEQYALILSEFYGNMITYDRALKWVRSIH